MFSFRFFKRVFFYRHLYTIKVYLPRRRASDKACDGISRCLTPLCAPLFRLCAFRALGRGARTCCARVGLFIKLRGWNNICGRKKKQESGSKKSLTYVLIFHADLQSEVVVFFILFSSKNDPPPLHKRNNTLSIIQLSSENPYQHL